MAVKQVVIEEITENQSILFENLEKQNKKLKEKLDQQSQQMDQQSQQIDQIGQLMLSNTNYGKGTPKNYFEQLKEKEGQKKKTVPSDPDDSSSSENSTENNSGDDEPSDNNDKERDSKDARSNIKEKRHKSTNKTRKHKDKWIRDPAQCLDSFIKVNTRFGGKQSEDVLAWFARLENNFEIFENKI